MAGATSGLHWDPVAERMIALARNAHRGVDRQDEIDYWYRLGQRNAYAHAAGIAVSRGVDSEAFAVSERLTEALTDNIVDLARLRDVALAGAGVTEVRLSPTWLGAVAFNRQYGRVPGLDHDYGMRWGAGGDHRITLRHPVAGDRGLLYAYDPTWDEYAVLARAATVQAVRATFARALQTDIHMSVTSFAALVNEQELALQADSVSTRGAEL